MNKRKSESCCDSVDVLKIMLQKSPTLFWAQSLGQNECFLSD